MKWILPDLDHFSFSEMSKIKLSRKVRQARFKMLSYFPQIWYSMLWKSKSSIFNFSNVWNLYFNLFLHLQIAWGIWFKTLSLIPAECSPQNFRLAVCEVSLGRLSPNIYLNLKTIRLTLFFLQCDHLPETMREERNSAEIPQDLAWGRFKPHSQSCVRISLHFLIPPSSHSWNTAQQYDLSYRNFP